MLNNNSERRDEKEHRKLIGVRNDIIITNCANEMKIKNEDQVAQLDQGIISIREKIVALFSKQSTSVISLFKNSLSD